MTEVGFYHLTRSTLEEALPRLLEKAYAAGLRAVVRVGDPERVELLNRALWTYAKESFLPHGTRADGWPERQPIYLSAEIDNPNGASLLVLVEDAPAPDLAGFARCLLLFDGNDPAAVGRARTRWREALAQGHKCVYWQQTARGGWTKAAEKDGAPPD
ncbi:DNA polymerase III subunit chi [Benzoatithermus flavus]|uniref:DNA polymerase III subunit chi n=1 Tax=Benzoatithermus flavus TaxID=3108223 RepID=A0ABU8XMN3_9PROT